MRRATEDDSEELQHFYRRAYGEARLKYKFPERWQWLYRNNPSIPDHKSLPIWIASEDGLIVGHTGAMYAQLKMGQDTRLAAWSVDTFVLQKYRGIGLGKRLQQANQDVHEVFISLHMSDANRYIKKEIGAFDGPDAALFVYTEKLHVHSFFERLRKALEKRLSARASELGWRVLHGSGIFHLISKRYERRLLAIQKDVDFSLEEKLDFIPVKGRFGSEVDTLWGRTRERFDFAVERSKAYLNWRFVDQPHTTYQRFYVFEKGMIKGLVIFRLGSAPEAPVGIIAEIFSIKLLTRPCACPDSFCVRMSSTSRCHGGLLC